MAYRRCELMRAGVLSAKDLRSAPTDTRVTAAGCVIARQRPGTALGFIFLSMEDETGIANVIIHPNLYEQNRALVTRVKFLLVGGMLQNQDGVIHIRADKLESLAISSIQISSHDFH
jgi:error-prone DNA polymerase